MLTPRLDALCPPHLKLPLTSYLGGEISGEIALMHFVLQLGAAGLLNTTLECLAAAAPEWPKLTDLARLAAANADHLPQIAVLANAGLTNHALAGSGSVAAIRAQFDQAVVLAPEASVALYSLGSAEILSHAAKEIVDRLAEWRLLGSNLRVLDVGCGIGRMERALAAHVGGIVAIDISPEMIKEAKRRSSDLLNVVFEQSSGCNLAGFANQSFDLVLCVDSFPYLFAVDPAIAAQHVGDAGRLLRPGGVLAILNFSYRGDEDADRREVARLAGINSFIVERAGTRDFSLWDGLTFLLTLPGRRE